MSSRPIYSLGLPQQTTRKLTQCGYETLQDLLNTPAESLASDMGISIDEAEKIVNTSRAPAPTLTVPSTQSAAAMAKHRKPLSTLSPPVDGLLQGGLLPGHLLEISGPPGTPKERIATDLASSFAASGQEVIFVDMQNMTGREELYDDSSSKKNRLISYMKLHSLPDLMVFMHNLLGFLESRPLTGLLVLNSISFPFQSSGLTNTAKNALFERIKKSLAATTLSKNLSVVVTSQLATKILNADGTVGSFDTGARGVMVPQLGSTYLPSGRTFRVVLGADGPASGIITLLSSPKDPQGNSPPPPVFYIVDADGSVQSRQ